MSDIDLSDLEKYTGLSPVEIAAARTDFHMSVCRDHVWDCRDCSKKLKEIQAMVAAVSSVIDEESRADERRTLVEQIAVAIEAYEPEAHPVVCPPSIAYAAAREKAVAIVRGFAPASVIREPEGAKR